MIRARVLALASILAVAVPAPALAEITLTLPAPDVTGLLTLAVPPLEKPPVPVPAVALPPIPQGMPELPPAPMVGHLGDRPVAPLPPPRFMACNPVGSVFGVASELIECGRARYQRGEFEPAREVLQKAVQEATERAQIREARYWLGETLLRLNKPADAERLMVQVSQDDPRGELGLYASHELGWVSLELSKPDRALAAFDTVLKSGAPPVLIPYARHGRALALYGLKRYGEARDTWVGLLNQNAPRTVAWEGTFWLGDSLGRLGDYPGAVQRLKTFVSGGPQVLIDSGLLRLGWWTRAAGQPLEAVKTYRGMLSAYPQSPEAPWARAGLAQALLDLDDFPGALDEAKKLEQTNRSGPLVIPTRLLLSRWAAEKGKVDEAREINDDLLARNLDPATRSYVLLLSAEASRLGGQASDARDRFQLVRNAPGSPALGAYATLRLAQLDFDTREFAQARDSARKLQGDSAVPAEIRAAALVLGGEAAYWARDYTQASTAYSTFLTNHGSYPQAPVASLALGWAELRGGKPDAARQRWTRFAQQSQSDSRAPEALVLAADMAGRAGDWAGAQSLLDQVVDRYPNSPYAEVATLNRAILAVRGGRAADALPELGRLVQRGSLSPYVSRARVTRGAALLATGKPADAERDFQSALSQGETGVAYLGLGSADFARQQWDAAIRDFTNARDAGGPVTAAANYGLAAVLFNQRKTAEFTQMATPLVAAGPVDPSTTPRLIHGLAAVAAEDKRWPEARTLTLRLVDQFPKYPGTPAALSSLAAAAAQGEEWTLSRDMYAKLGERYPDSVASTGNRLDYAEALLRTGAAAEAKRALEPAPGGTAQTQSPRAAMLMAEAQEATGDRAGALDAYARAVASAANPREKAVGLLGQGRLLAAEGKWNDARPLLEQALDAADGSMASEAAYRLGEGYRATGKTQDAADMYLTAAYLGSDSPWTRRALVAAGNAFAALKQKDAAVIVYRKVLAMSGVEPELADAARKGLRALGAS
ncbi:MAG TPA: tetratricopeptide repeat protein [Methylomirabilota bacterium]|nr:tetratricopeptide repeat protein [Methylomirabilota bacterium]